ncbi:MAG: AMP-binding protein [Oligoflexia bacterium]|nr:AMP-binding protein [Oligoflexia bacterium]
MLSDQTINDFYLKLKKIVSSSPYLAYRHYNEKYSYAELYARMLKVNAILSRYQNAQILLYANKSVSSYATIFSIFLSNNVWVPLSPDLPFSRNVTILKKIDPIIIFHDVTLPDDLRNYLKEKNIIMVSLEEIVQESSNNKVEFNNLPSNKQDIAYIMFTSGSTGEPKGVPMTHENYINFALNIFKVLSFKQGEDVFSDFHDFAFDISIFSLFACVFSEGAFSPIIEKKDRILPLGHIIDNGVTVWSSVPSVINRIKRFRPNTKHTTPIRIMFLCGEPLALDLLYYCFENMNLPQVYNFYGLTETGVENFYHECFPEDIAKFAKFGVAPIGKPLPENFIQITKDKELWLSGCQLTPGYLKGVSTEKFEIQNNVRWYKTGDIVEEYEGLYYCKGRVDTQVKLSGHRVELMDIEACIVRQQSIERAICFVDNKQRIPMLIAAIKSRHQIVINELRISLAKELPDYMIPQHFKVMDDFPLNANGKIDRKKIAELY